MEYKVNKHSTETLETLFQKFIDAHIEELEKKHQHKLEFEREYGFKTFDEIIDYLKSGNVIGDFSYNYGEQTMTNDFMIWDDAEQKVLRRYQYSDIDGISFWMTWKSYTEDELKKLVDFCNDRKNEEGYLPTVVFKKNLEITSKEIKQFYKLILI